MKVSNVGVEYFIERGRYDETIVLVSEARQNNLGLEGERIIHARGADLHTYSILYFSLQNYLKAKEEYFNQ